jgi:hypothetical protein
MKPVPQSLRLCAAVALALTAACSGSTAGAASVAPPSNSTVVYPTARISPQTARDNLVYAADGESDALFIFDYKPNALKFVTYVPLGSTPIAECVDTAQDVWVVTNTELLLEFAHGGTTPIATIGTPGITPGSCSVDPTTGNLAVSVEEAGKPAVLVYKNGKGRPQEYLAGSHLLSACTYDGHGNLYIDFKVYGTDVSFGILPKGGSSLQFVTSNQMFDSPGFMQWDGKYLDVADEDTDTLYRFNVNLSGASVVDSLVFDQTQRIGGFFIYRKRIVVPSSYSEHMAGGLLSIYHYPQGGKRIQTVRNMSLAAAAVVSLGPKGGSL